MQKLCSNSCCLRELIHFARSWRLACGREELQRSQSRAMRTSSTPLLFREAALRMWTWRTSGASGHNELSKRSTAGQQDSEHRAAIVGNGNQFPRTPSCSVWSVRGVTTDKHSGQLSCPQRSAQGSYSEIRRICTRLPMSGKRSSGLITVVLSIPLLW